MSCTIGSAPGRLDLLGGVADYSGALVLEVPTQQSIEVVAEEGDRARGRTGRSLRRGDQQPRELEYDDVSRALDGLPRWTHYLIGVAVVLVRYGIIEPPRVSLRISSDLPASMGVASSAALEVATARALGARASTHCNWPCGVRRPRTPWWVPLAVSWTRWRSRWGLPVRCCPSCAGRRPPGLP